MTLCWYTRIADQYPFEGNHDIFINVSKFFKSNQAASTDFGMIIFMRAPRFREAQLNSGRKIIGEMNSCQLKSDHSYQLFVYCVKHFIVFRHTFHYVFNMIKMIKT